MTRKLILGILLLLLATDLFAQSSVRRRPVFPAGGITLVASDSAGITTGGTTITRSYTTTTGNTLIFLVPYTDATDTVSSITWNSLTASAITGANALTSSRGCAAYILTGVTAATSNAVVTFSGAVYGRLFILEYSGVDQAAPTHDGTSNGSSTGTEASITVANIASTDLVIDVLDGAPTTHTSTVGADQTQLMYERDVNIDDVMAASSQSGANGGVMTWTLNAAAARVQCAFALKKAA